MAASRSFVAILLSIGLRRSEAQHQRALGFFEYGLILVVCQNGRSPYPPRAGRLRVGGHERYGHPRSPSGQAQRLLHPFRDFSSCHTLHVGLTTMACQLIA
jgi:hypothetical protein